jgi:hypothetical protein
LRLNFWVNTALIGEEDPDFDGLIGGRLPASQKLGSDLLRASELPGVHKRVNSPQQEDKNSQKDALVH